MKLIGQSHHIRLLSTKTSLLCCFSDYLWTYISLQNSHLLSLVIEGSHYHDIPQKQSASHCFFFCHNYGHSLSSLNKSTSIPTGPRCSLFHWAMKLLQIILLFLHMPLIFHAQGTDALCYSSRNYHPYPYVDNFFPTSFWNRDNQKGEYLLW